MAELTPAALDGAQIVMLLTLQFAGRVWRFATRPVVIASGSGSLAYLGGLSETIEVEDGFTWGQAAPAEAEVSVDLVWPESLPVLAARGFSLSSARGELAAWIPGTAFEHRQRIMADAVVRSPNTGADSESVSFTLSAAVGTDGGVLPGDTFERNVGYLANADSDAEREQSMRFAMQATAALALTGGPPVVMQDTWPDADEDIVNTYYPMVFGTPGEYTETDGTAVTAVKGTPGLGIAITPVRALVAGHRIDATTVDVWNLSLDPAEQQTGLAVEYEQDATGRTVALVDLSGEITWEVDHEYWINWPDGGGLHNLTESGPLDGAGDVLRFMLSRSTVRLDAGRTAAAAHHLNAYRLGGYIDDGCTPWEWVNDNLLSILPVSMAMGPNGVFPIVWDLDATRSDCIAEVTEGPGWVRDSQIEHDDDDSVVNELRFSFANDGGDHKRTIVIGGGEFDPDVPDVYTCHQARRSQSKRWGRRTEELTSDIVYDTATAVALATAYVRARAFPVRRVSYLAGNEWAWLRPGRPVWLVDAAQRIEGVAIIERRQWSTRGMRFVVVLIDEDRDS